MFDYNELIRSIAYDFLDEIQYNPDMDFEEVWERVDGYSKVHQLVDTYLPGSLKGKLHVIVSSDKNPADVDAGLYAEANDWLQSTTLVAFEILNLDCLEFIEWHMRRGKPMLLPGGIVPETNRLQMWFGKHAPEILFEQEVHYAVQREPVHLFSVPSGVKLRMGSDSLMFEGTVYEADPRDIKELSLGARKAMRPTRIYVQHKAYSAEAPSVTDYFDLAIKDKWITLPEYAEYSPPLPKLQIL